MLVAGFSRRLHAETEHNHFTLGFASHFGLDLFAPPPMHKPPKLNCTRERRIVEEIVESAIRPTERWASLRFCPPLYLYYGNG